ncbi:MAG: glycosyltransferase [Candidatus Daviesbacteria bacterium]|nr:glycosyltransferase [Candidatus Daviesbacteria bacterium]
MKLSKTSLRVGLYSPYLDTFGGGERYMLTIAEQLSKDHEVDILLDKHLLTLNPQEIVKKSLQRFNLNLSKVNFRKSPLGQGSNLVERLFFLKQYNLLFYLTDGSIFYSTAGKSILHFQAPFTNSNLGIWGRFKLSSWKLGICNSVFTQNLIKQTWPIKTKVVYPPVGVSQIKPLKKEKYILSVGRFFGFLRNKKHEEMIKAFKELSLNKKKLGWSLHLVGSASEGDLPYLADLKKIAGANPSIFFYPNLSFDKLSKLYGQSQIYWHAAGLGEEDPVNMEHFGITTVEAMAGGCVPVVINKGGQTEIVEDGINGFLWNNLDELIKLTQNLIDQNPLLKQISQKAVERSKIFSKEKFTRNIDSLIND